MSEHHDHQVPDDLEPIVSRLRDKTPYADPLELDRRKQRVLARLRSPRGTRWSFRYRIATILAVVGFAAGSGGAIALATSGSTGMAGGAAMGQYCNHHKLDGDHDHDCDHFHHHHCNRHKLDGDRDHDCDHLGEHHHHHHHHHD
jgi:hypothetical protein